MRLNNLVIIDSTNKELHVMTKFITKEKIEVQLYINDILFIQNVARNYYEDDHFRIIIDGFYENIYNSLDLVFVFINMCNCIEVLGFCNGIEDGLKNNLDLIHNLRLQYDNKSSSDELKGISLKDELFYFITYFRNITPDIKYNSFIHRINITRNYYVHGHSSKNIFSFDEIVLVNNYLRYLVFYVILVMCNEDAVILFFRDIIGKILISIENKYLLQNNNE